MNIRVLSVLLFIAPAAAVAQESNLNMFLFEKSYATLAGSPRTINAPLYYEPEPSTFSEVNLVSHFPLWRRVHSDRMYTGNMKRIRTNLFLTTQFRFRALQVPSIPIRGMSAMPRFTFQLIKSIRQKRYDPKEGMRHFLGMNVILGHHSNGGDGCVFVHETFNSSGTKCIATTQVAAEDREVKTDGGNFSTNYVEAGLYWRGGRVSTDPKTHWLWVVDAGIAYQQHHNIDFPIPGGAVKGFRDIYGPSRFRIELEAHHVLLKNWAVLRLWVNREFFGTKIDRYDGALNYRFESLLFIQGATPKDKWWASLIRQVGIGLRYAQGQDYHNLQFVRNISLIQVVFLVDTWSPWKE